MCTTVNNKQCDSDSTLRYTYISYFLSLRFEVSLSSYVLNTILHILFDTQASTKPHRRWFVTGYWLENLLVKSHPLQVSGGRSVQLTISVQC